MAEKIKRVRRVRQWCPGVLNLMLVLILLHTDATSVARASDNPEVVPENNSNEIQIVSERPAAGAGAWQNAVVPFYSLRSFTPDRRSGRIYGNDRGPFTAGMMKIGYQHLALMESLDAIYPLYLPTMKISLDRVDAMSPADLTNWLTGVENRAAPLIYVHGYNVDFEKAIKRTWLIQQRLNRQLVLFSWASYGDTVTYARDEASVMLSVNHLQQIITSLAAAFPATGEDGLSIVTHSMGARGVVHALSTLAQITDSSRRPLIRHLVLMAADMDAQLFAQKLPDLRRVAENITIYVSANDAPLRLSAELHGYPRLGLRSEATEKLVGVDVIDVSSLPIRRVSGHLYHYVNPWVTADLAVLLNSGVPAGERDTLVREAESDNIWLPVRRRR